MASFGPLQPWCTVRPALATFGLLQPWHSALFGQLRPWCTHSSLGEDGLGLGLLSRHHGSLLSVPSKTELSHRETQALQKTNHNHAACEQRTSKYQSRIWTKKDNIWMDHDHARQSINSFIFGLFTSAVVVKCFTVANTFKYW